jgi:hypothetical protein
LITSKKVKNETKKKVAARAGSGERAKREGRDK